MTTPRKPKCAHRDCDRLPIHGWTTCPRHYSAGRRKNPRGFQRKPATTSAR